MSPSDLAGLKKFLIIQTASIGDVILATPVLEKLHAKFPEAELSVLVKKGNEGLFQGHPFLTEVLIWDKSRKWSDLHRLVHLIRESRYDAVITLQRYASTGLMTACSGARLRIGFRKNPFSLFFTTSVAHRFGRRIHEAERNLELIRSITDETFFPPRLYPPQRRYHAGRYYTISPASLWATKQYPMDKWVELIRTIPAEASVFLLGSLSDIRLCDAIHKETRHPHMFNMAGRLTLIEAAALMKGAKMNFTNDSAPTHLASAVNAPVTAVFCSTVPAFGFGPLSSDSCVVEFDGPLSCRPCGIHGLAACPEGHFRCALGIRVEQLTARL